MSPRYQKYRLKWPLTPNQLINIDEMFSEIFTDLAKQSLTIIPSQISGIIGVPNGGTGIGGYTKGDIITATSPTTLGVISSGPAGYVLTSNGIGSIPSYQASSAFGYWSPLTDGNVDETDLIFASGEPIMTFIPAP